MAILVILGLKATAGAKVSLPLYLASLFLALAAQAFRTWAAGYVGTLARERAVLGEVLITAGPYAYVRNPMYLGILVILLAFSLMSGLWFSPLIALTTYAFVYNKVIPYEEDYLAQKFKAEYAEYRSRVPRLWPMLRPYPHRQGHFDLREALSNEVFAIPGLLTVTALFYFI
ncbi:MAG: isoprenylcysteine carboxylmethyltransferase family protein [Chloroflexi bacterium]|nr:isoprenylcysteine carboxylmethyltransferase family protein [Chloroflexota bacterium]